MAVEFYGTDWCPYCVAAERLLTEREIPYTQVELEYGELRERVWELSRRHTIPLIVIDGDPIGGYDELVVLDRSGVLAELTGSAAA
jgi:glutaredoxin 3